METEFIKSTAAADDNLDQKFPEQILKSKIRGSISAQAGDTESLLGTTADATQVLLYGFTSLIAKLSTANSLAEVREAASPFSELSNNFLAKIEAEDVKLPFMAKGLESVINDIEKRATAVASVLENANE